MIHGLDGNGLILRKREPFLDKLKQVVPERKVKLIEPYVYSSDHKLNVARYCAALIRATQPDDYGRHRYGDASSSGFCSTAEYSQHCIYYAYDWDQYALSLLFFIESFAAAAFSLFDSSGHLLKEIYNLPLRSDETNFVKATDKLKSLAPRMYSFLARYRLDDLSCLSWFKLLKELRNHTTHAQVTDIVKLDTPMPPHSHEIRLWGQSIQATDDPVLREFSEACFIGLEEYVEQLYEKLTKQVEAEKSLPLTGRFDHLA